MRWPLPRLPVIRESNAGMAASNIPWNDVTQIHIVWNDDQNNHFVVSFDGPASAP